MKLERRHAWLLLGVGVWNLLTYAMFTRNLWSAHESGEDRPTGYWVAHTVLIVVNVAIGVVLGRLGLKGPASLTRLSGRATSRCAGPY